MGARWLVLRAMVLVGLLAGNSGVAPVRGAGHQHKIDPFLRLQLDADRAPLSLQRASAAQAAIDESSPLWSPWSPGNSFHTRAVSGNTIRAVGPAVSSTATLRVPALTWHNSDPGVFYYELGLSKDPAFGAQGPVAMVYSALLHGGATTPPNTYVVPSSAPLEPSTTYHWRVRPRVQGDGTPVPWPQAFSFTTVP